MRRVTALASLQVLAACARVASGPESPQAPSEDQLYEISTTVLESKDHCGPPRR